MEAGLGGKAERYVPRVLAGALLRIPRRGSCAPRRRAARTAAVRDDAPRTGLRRAPTRRRRSPRPRQDDAGVEQPPTSGGAPTIPKRASQRAQRASTCGSRPPKRPPGGESAGTSASSCAPAGSVEAAPASEVVGLLAGSCTVTP